MHCSIFSDRKVTEKAATRLYSGRTEKQGRQLPDRVAGLKLALSCFLLEAHLCSLLNYIVEHTCCTVSVSWFLQDDGYKIRVSCCPPLLDASAFPHTHVLRAEVAGPESKVLLGEATSWCWLDAKYKASSTGR